MAQTVNNLHAMHETGFDPWVRKIPWRRERLPIPVFLPGDLHGQRSLADHGPWGRRESDMTEVTKHTSAYLRLLFLLAILVPACDSSNLAFCMMYSAYKLNRQTIYSLIVLLSQFGTSLYCSISDSNCCFWTCIQVPQEAGKVVW